MVFGYEHIHPVFAWLAFAWLAFAVFSAMRARRERQPGSVSRPPRGLAVAGGIALGLALVTGEIAAAVWTRRGEVLPESVVARHRLFGYAALTALLIRAALARRAPRWLMDSLDAVVVSALAVCVWHGMTITYTFGVNVDLPGAR